MGNFLSFKWINWIPLKLNCFAWRLFQNRIPTFLNLIKTRVTISSSLCPFCRIDEEGVDHIFFFLMSYLWRWLMNWSSLFTRLSNNYHDLMRCLSLRPKVNTWRVAFIFILHHTMDDMVDRKCYCFQEYKTNDYVDCRWY